MRTVNIDSLKTRLLYDPNSGTITWLPRPSSDFKSARAYLAWAARFKNKQGFTANTASGYKMGRFDKVNLLAHRVAWALHYGVWPEGEVDHINGDRTDNRISNLRVVSTRDNARNKRMSARNVTGVSGVYWHKAAGMWCVSINKNDRVGYFREFADAVNARKEAELTHGYHQNHGRAA